MVFQSTVAVVGISGQISIIPKPELRGFWGSSLIKPPFRVTSARNVVIICPGICWNIPLFSSHGNLTILLSFEDRGPGLGDTWLISIVIVNPLRIGLWDLNGL